MMLSQPEAKKALERWVCPRGSVEDAGKYPDSLEHCFILSFFPKEKPPGAARQEDALSFAEQWTHSWMGSLLIESFLADSRDLQSSKAAYSGPAFSWELIWRIPRLQCGTAPCHIHVWRNDAFPHIPCSFLHKEHRSIQRFWGFQGRLPGWERIVPKGDLGSATGWMKRFVGMLNLAAAFHPKRSHFAPVWEDKGTGNEHEGDFSA